MLETYVFAGIVGVSLLIIVIVFLVLWWLSSKKKNLLGSTPVQGGNGWPCQADENCSTPNFTCDTTLLQCRSSNDPCPIGNCQRSPTSNQCLNIATGGNPPQYRCNIINVDCGGKTSEECQRERAFVADNIGLRLLFDQTDSSKTLISVAACPPSTDTFCKNVAGDCITGDTGTICEFKKPDTWVVNLGVPGNIYMVYTPSLYKPST